MGCGSFKATGSTEYRIGEVGPEAQTASASYSEPTSTPFFADSPADRTLPSGGVLAGFGASAHADDKAAAAEALQAAAKSLAHSAGSSLSPAPTLALVSCAAGRDPEVIRQEMVRAMPEVLLHGFTSSMACFGPEGSVRNGLGCLLLEAPDGSFVTAWDDTGDAQGAVQWLHDLMPDPQAILMSTAPGVEEAVLLSLEASFPGIPVYGGTAADSNISGNWTVMSHLGSSSNGISLVGIADGLGFGGVLLGTSQPSNTVAKVSKVDAGSQGCRKVLEVDSRPAADWARANLFQKGGESQAAGIVELSKAKRLGVRHPGRTDIAPVQLRSLDGPGGCIEFFASITEGAELVVMDEGRDVAAGFKASLMEAVDAAMSAGAITKPTACLTFLSASAVASVGAESVDRALSSTFKDQNPELPMLGAACFGEQGHLMDGRINAHYNFGIGMILFGEQAPLLGILTDEGGSDVLSPRTEEERLQEEGPTLHRPELPEAKDELQPMSLVPTQPVDEQPAGLHPATRMPSCDSEAPGLCAACCFQPVHSKKNDIATDLD